MYFKISQRCKFQLFMIVLRARLNGKIVCTFFYYLLIIFQLFFNQNGATSLASLCEKNDFSKFIGRSFSFRV